MSAIVNRRRYMGQIWKEVYCYKTNDDNTRIRTFFNNNNHGFKKGDIIIIDLPPTLGASITTHKVIDSYDSFQPRLNTYGVWAENNSGKYIIKEDCNIIGINVYTIPTNGRLRRGDIQQYLDNCHVRTYNI